MKYDYLVVGAGLYGATFACQMQKAGKKCLVIDKRPHIAGNAYTERRENIDIHMYGAKIFHTRHRIVWDFVNHYAIFNNYHHKVKATFKDKVYSLPINLNTFYQFWGCKTPGEAKSRLDEARSKYPMATDNLQNWSLGQLGDEIYYTLYHGYTKKQWCREPSEVPAGIIKRLPIRFTWDDDYFDDPYQGIPVDGYTAMVAQMLEGIDVQLGTDFFFFGDWRKIADKLIFTGPIDQFCDYKFGALEYLSLQFVHHHVSVEDYQGISVMNFTDEKFPFTRTIEHKHFTNAKSKTTFVTQEYPQKYSPGVEPYYPVNTQKNQDLYLKYKEEVEKEPDVFLGGRLGTFSYINMDQTVLLALEAAKLMESV